MTTLLMMEFMDRGIDETMLKPLLETRRKHHTPLLGSICSPQAVLKH